MPTVAEKRSRLAERMRAREFTVAPGIFDMISARLADRTGFHALYMTGYGVAASHAGLPDAGLTTYRELVDRARLICESTQTPLIADADTGFGGLLNVRHTVRGYETAGVAAIQIEDQEYPKKCGHTPGRRVVPLSDMLRKIEVAAATREADDFLIVARTDARTTLGLDEAIARGKAFHAAGADVVFVESPESIDEFERIGQEVDAPLLANMVEQGRSPILDAERLGALGFALAIYPASGFLAAASALDSVYAHLREHGTTNGMSTPILPFQEMNRLMGFEEVWAFEREWAEPE